MNWLDIFYAFLSLLGGIGVFLYGMKLMGDSLEMVAGNEIKRMFAKISNKKLIGVMTPTYFVDFKSFPKIVKDPSCSIGGNEPLYVSLFTKKQLIK